MITAIPIAIIKRYAIASIIAGEQRTVHSKLEVGEQRFNAEVFHEALSTDRIL